jgi:hypothetical protein
MLDQQQYHDPDGAIEAAGISLLLAAFGQPTFRSSTD